MVSWLCLNDEEFPTDSEMLFQTLSKVNHSVRTINAQMKLVLEAKMIRTHINMLAALVA